MLTPGTLFESIQINYFPFEDNLTIFCLFYIFVVGLSPPEINISCACLFYILLNFDLVSNSNLVFSHSPHHEMMLISLRLTAHLVDVSPRGKLFKFKILSLKN